MDQCYSSVYLASKGKYILEARVGRPKRHEERSLSSILAPLFICFFLLPLSLPFKLGYPGGLFVYLRFSLQSSDFILFLWAFLFFVFYGLLFPILTT